jgi:large subunit ribosomal protein L24
MGAKIKKGDLVQVIAGSDRNKQGKVLKVFPAAQRVLVEGINRVTKHTKAGQTERGTQTGGIEVVEAPMHISNVAIVDPETKKPTRVGFREETVEKNGVSKTVRVRFAKSSGKAL